MTYVITVLNESFPFIQRSLGLEQRKEISDQDDDNNTTITCNPETALERAVRDAR